MRNSRYDQSMRTLRYGNESRPGREDDEPELRPPCPECFRRGDAHARNCSVAPRKGER